ncbi:hypothetical protein BDR07DRAFT_166797 [Suillus spraguei]|nr:hypothetical protein BDR07DRAFT_1082874 [Suillus spraguei]KAG2360228.1 hypothetical protein BDR07DRAFT_166797 [Suillus spraguei]
MLVYSLAWTWLSIRLTFPTRTLSSFSYICDSSRTFIFIFIFVVNPHNHMQLSIDFACFLYVTIHWGATSRYVATLGPVKRLQKGRRMISS